MAEPTEQPAARREEPGGHYVEICLDDASRNSFGKVMKSERHGSAVVLLKAAFATSLRIKVTAS
ncbi:hypothetical protein CVM73_20230 [Bradyrhizobium forestalis]|uniref:Uncharacterized protein n=1 Tax=Bradyrhizobium forestalis TaxID=1419263 RepID=A0A2M8R6Q4_9BRAD|nr:hypothetical protein CVM73_20230 [Bradyrhizobium forestalis]